MRVVAVIPARYASSRFPGKPLAPLNGKPMIQHVYERVRACTLFNEVIVATDDERILNAVKKFNGVCELTSLSHFTGTDRVCEVASRIDAEIIVNVQGDEPLLDPKPLHEAITWVKEKKFPMATLSVPLRNHQALTNMNVVKVLTDQNQRALYFSRYPIPYSRTSPTDAVMPFICQQHVGVYIFERETLFRFQKLEPSTIEKGESLEQLRALQNGIPLGVVRADFISIGVDTLEDLVAAEKILKGE